MISSGDGDSAELSTRAEHLLRTIVPSRSKGLEIGALDSPVVTRAMGDISYVDHADAAQLRADFAHRTEVDIARIVEVDYVVDAAVDGLRLPELVGEGVLFDYVVASNVIEHIPNPIAWFADLHAVLHPGGVVSLAVPDKRQCFDFLRTNTVVAQLIDAYLNDLAAPTPGQVYDHYASAVAWNGAISWVGRPLVTDLELLHTEIAALSRARHTASAADYSDVHCWVFTPESFERIFRALRHLGLLQFEVESCSETIGAEFYVRLRSTDEPPVDVPPPSAVTAANVLGTPTRDLVDARLRLAHALHERDDARSTVQAMTATSSWKLTRPLRSLNGFLKRRSTQASRQVRDVS